MDPACGVRDTAKAGRFRQPSRPARSRRAARKGCRGQGLARIHLTPGQYARRLHLGMASRRHCRRVPSADVARGVLRLSFEILRPVGEEVVSRVDVVLLDPLRQGAPCLVLSTAQHRPRNADEQEVGKGGQDPGRPAPGRGPGGAGGAIRRGGGGPGWRESGGAGEAPRSRKRACRTGIVPGAVSSSLLTNWRWMLSRPLSQRRLL